MYKKVSVKIIIIMIIAPILTVPSSGLQISHAQSNADLQNTVLSIHNRERALVGVPALVWSDQLAAGAQTWADHLATINEMVHSTDMSYGENLAGKRTGGDTVPTMVESWVAEKKDYHGETIDSTNYLVFGHYTQMVWQNTREVGCGMATGSVNDFLVCRYSPPGNSVGQLPYGQGAAPAVADEDAGAPPADQAAGDEGDGVGGAQPPVCIFPEVLNPETNQCEVPQPPPVCIFPEVLNPETNQCDVPQPPPADEDAAAPPADEGGDGDGGDINGDGDGDGN
jgi:hypothetical protein